MCAMFSLHTLIINLTHNYCTMHNASILKAEILSQEQKHYTVQAVVYTQLNEVHNNILFPSDLVSLL